MSHHILIYTVCHFVLVLSFCNGGPIHSNSTSTQRQSPLLKYRNESVYNLTMTLLVNENFWYLLSTTEPGRYVWGRWGSEGECRVGSGCTLKALGIMVLLYMALQLNGQTSLLRNKVGLRYSPKIGKKNVHPQVLPSQVMVKKSNWDNERKMAVNHV